MANENGSSVGVISLSLVIESELNKQLEAIKKDIQGQCKDIGDTAEKALTDSVEQAVSKIEKPVEEVGKTLEKSVSEGAEKAAKKAEEALKEPVKKLSEEAQKAMDDYIKKVMSTPIKEGVNNYDKGAMEFVENYKPKSEEKPAAPEIDVEAFNISDDPIERLNQSLELTNEKIELAQEKWRKLHTEMAALSDEEMEGDKGNAIISQINSVEASMLRLQQQADSTKAKIDKAMQPPPAVEKLEQSVNKTATAIKYTAEKPMKQLNASMKKLGTTASGSFGKAGKAVSGFGKSVKSALKSTFLMAGLYAIFRGLKSAISSAMNANDKFSNSVKQIKGNLQVAFTPIVNAIMPALNTLAQGLAAATKAVASFISGLFGTTYKQSVEATKQIEAVGDAAKKNSRFLTSFDEMNVAQDNNSDEESNLDALDSTGDKIAEGIGDKIRKVIISSITFIKKKFTELKKFFTNNFAPVFAEIGEKLGPVIEEFGKNLGKAWSDLQKLVEPFKDFITNNLVPALQTAFLNIGTVASGLGDTFNLVFGTLWDSVIFPTLETMTTTVLPTLTDMWSTMGTLMTTVFTEIKTIFDEVFTTGIMPVLETAQGIWSDFCTTVSNLWYEYGEPMINNINTLVRSVGDTLLNVYKTYIEPVINFVCEVVESLWNNTIKPIYEKVVSVISKLIEYITAVWVRIKPVVDWVVNTMRPVIVNTFNAIKGVIDTVFSFIGGAVSAVLTSLGGFIDFLTGVFTLNWDKAWEGIKEMFGGVWDGIVNVFKTAVNLIIDGLNLCWTGIYTVVKGIVDSIGGIAGALGALFGQDWHFSMPEEPPLIPKLAKGGLAYAPTLAMVGDNRNAGSDPEVIAPLSKLKDIIGEGGDMTEVVLLLREILEFLKGMNLIAKGEVDGKTLYRMIVQLNKENTYRTGVNALG